jgi:GTP:adenosylcobinamide-phosphate guanylyltransferase
VIKYEKALGLSTFQHTENTNFLNIFIPELLININLVIHINDSSDIVRALIELSWTVTV